MPQSLFVKEPQFEKVAAVKLNQDSTQWPLEIVQHLHEEHPYLAETESSVVFKKQDKNRGYGYGFLKVGENIRVPIVVSGYEMKPLDVWLDQEGKTSPLSEEAIKAATMGTQLGATRKPQTDGYVDSLIYSRTYPPYDGKYVYASAKGDEPKGGLIRGREYISILSAIPMDEQEKKAAIESLSEEVVAGMRINGTYDVLKNWANDGFEKVAAAYMEKTAAPREKYKIPDAIIKEDLSVGDTQVADEYGTYICEGSSGAKYKGHVFPHIHDFDLNKVSLSIFKGRHEKTEAEKNMMYGDNKCSSVQSLIAGQKCPSEGGIYDEHGRNGDRGFFVKEKGDSAIALIPVTILAHSTTNEHHETRKNSCSSGKRVKVEVDYSIEKYHCKTDLGEHLTITKSPNVINVVRDGQTVMIPASMVFCKLSNPVRLKSDPSLIKKAAEMESGANELKVRHGHGTFSFQGRMVSDYELQDGVTEKQAREFLSETWTDEAVDVIIKRAQKGYIPGAIHIVVPTEELTKIAQYDVEVRVKGEVVEGHGRLAEKIQALTHGLDKCAATMQDAGLVDTVLSLKFLNKDNLNKYAEFIPQFEEASAHLADLLVASRLGLQLQEYPIKTAMENISTVIGQLKTIRGK